jgi:hypothetical protein
VALSAPYLAPVLPRLTSIAFTRDNAMFERRATRLMLLLAIAVATVTSSAKAQDQLGPCSVVSLDQIAAVTGVRVTNTFPSGNLSAGAQCTYGGGDRPPTVTVAMARGAPGARDAYETNLRFPSVSPVDSLGITAVWIPALRKLAVLARDDLYLIVTMNAVVAGGPPAARARAVALARLALERLGAGLQ